MARSASEKPHAPHGPGLAVRMDLEARRIAGQHEKLRALHDQVRGAVSGGDVHAAREALEHLRDALESHFSLEEEIFFPALQELRPTVADSLRALSSEHAALRSQLETLASRLGFGRLTSQQGPYEAFVDALGQHERQEETLLAAFRKHAER